MDFSKQTREIIKERDKVCVYCGKPIDHIHHVFVKRRIASDNKKNAVALCYMHHNIIHSSSKMSQKVQDYCEDYLISIYGEIDLEDLKISKFKKDIFKFYK